MRGCESIHWTWPVDWALSLSSNNSQRLFANRFFAVLCRREINAGIINFIFFSINFFVSHFRHYGKYVGRREMLHEYLLQFFIATVAIARCFIDGVRAELRRCECSIHSSGCKYKIVGQVKFDSMNGEENFKTGNVEKRIFNGRQPRQWNVRVEHISRMNGHGEKRKYAEWMQTKFYAQPNDYWTRDVFFSLISHELNNEEHPPHRARRCRQVAVGDVRCAHGAFISFSQFIKYELLWSIRLTAFRSVTFIAMQNFHFATECI